MPIYKTELNGKVGGWAIWHITEDEKTLTEIVQNSISWIATDRCPDDVHMSNKRLEWLAGRVVLRTLLKQAHLEYQGISKDNYGKPVLVGLPQRISLSHSYPYVAAQFHSGHEVGIDVEQPKEKLLRIAPRVLSQSEQLDAGIDLQKNCIYWCAKEALYKIHGKRSLSFAQNLQVQSFNLNKKGVLQGKIATSDAQQMVNLGYSVEPDFVIVFTADKG